MYCQFVFDQKAMYIEAKVLKYKFLLIVTRISVMQRFLPLDCAVCNRQTDSLQEKLQQKLALISLNSTHSQNETSDLHPPHPPQKLDSGKTVIRQKKSLKNAKNNASKLVDSTNTLSQQSCSLNGNNSRLVKSPSAKVVITYRPSSFAPPLNCQPTASKAEPFLALQDRNFWKSKREIKNYELPKNIESRVEICTKNQLNDKSLALEYQTEQNRKNLQKVKQNEANIQNEQPDLIYQRTIKVHFTQFNQRAGNFDYRQVYSAFGSIANTNHNIPFDQQEDFQSAKVTGTEIKQNLANVSDIMQEQKVEIRRALKKNLTCFKAPQKKFFGVRTVNTIKSIDTPSQQSYLDLKYMQDRQIGFQYRLTQ